MRRNVSSGHMFLSLESCSDIRETFLTQKINTSAGVQGRKLFSSQQVLPISSTRTKTLSWALSEMHNQALTSL